MKHNLSPGDVFGRWTVLDENLLTEKGERKWLCRCECGSERYVLERGLIYGGSTSCGCLSREHCGRKPVLMLEGQSFGDLTVIARDAKRADNGAVIWLCRCACGSECTATTAQLIKGQRTHCGCKGRRRRSYADITGRRFHRLVALEPLEQRDNAGYVVWRCRCDCGNVTELSYNALMYGNVRSCGCRKREHAEQLSEHLTHVAGTSLDMIKSTKLPKNNTTGVKGVYLVKGKYVAKIVFQKKQYFLGTFDELEDAKAARLEAEKQIRESVVDCYTRWKQRADADPAWAKENPVQITVERDGNNRLRLVCLPEMK